MATYAYEAMNSAGKVQKGTIEADSSEDALKKIKGQGFFPTSVREQRIKGGGEGKAAKAKAAGPKKKGKGFNFSIGGVPLKRMTLFTRQLSTLQDAGLPLLGRCRSSSSSRSPASSRTSSAESARMSRAAAPSPTPSASTRRPSTGSTPRWWPRARSAACST
jgi:type IV pilus assembly protein PilC